MDGALSPLLPSPWLGGLRESTTNVIVDANVFGEL